MKGNNPIIMEIKSG